MTKNRIDKYQEEENITDVVDQLKEVFHESVNEISRTSLFLLSENLDTIITEITEGRRENASYHQSQNEEFLKLTKVISDLTTTINTLNAQHPEELVNVQESITDLQEKMNYLSSQGENISNVELQNNRNEMNNILSNNSKKSSILIHTIFGSPQTRITRTTNNANYAIKKEARKIAKKIQTDSKKLGKHIKDLVPTNHKKRSSRSRG